MMKTTKIITFDCDGVMFDSRNSNKTYYNTLLRKLNLPEMSDEQTIYAHTHTVSETITNLIKNTNCSIEKINTIRQKISYLSFVKLMKIEPSLCSILDKLTLKFKTAIATNRTHSIWEILSYHRITNLFDFVICSSDVQFPKPNPSMLNKTVSHFRVKPSEVVYIGDSKLDEMASNSAKIPFIAYKNKSLNAFAHINSLSELGNIIPF